MKAILPLFLALVAHASAFDEAAFGQSLNGWTRDGSAHYPLDGARYRTLKPVESVDAEGNLVVTVTVIHQANPWAEVPFDLEVVFASDGSARSLRITGSPKGQKVDTGLISWPGDTEAPLAEMKKMLFESFEPQVARAAEAKDIRKRDLLARIYGPEPIDPAALSAGLRYNLDLILRLPNRSK